MTDVIEGGTAPNFQLQTENGVVSLADFASKTLVLYFYPKDETGGCTKEAQEFTALMPEFVKAGATIIGVSKDSLASHKKFTAKYDLAVQLGSDPDAALIGRYGEDSIIVKTAATMFGSTETTFYVIAVYFGAVNIRKTRHAIPAGLIADISAMIFAVYVVRWLFT